MKRVVYGIGAFCWCVQWIGCSADLDDQINQLALGGEGRDVAKQELLLAKERAIEPLLVALEAPQLENARREVVDVLFSLMTRVEDARISAALLERLASDADPQVRALVAQRMGMFMHKEAAPALFKALTDEADDVRHQAIMSLGELSSRLDSSQALRLDQEARRLLNDPHEGVQLESMIRVEYRVNQWVEEAKQTALKAQIAPAESLYHKALAYSPNSKLANYQLGRFYLDNGDDAKGLDWLRQHGMLLDVPRLERAPDIDGKIEADEWQGAVRADSFYEFGWNHFAAAPAKVKTEFYMGYTEEGFYVGFYCYDAHPDSLVAKIKTIEMVDAEADGNISERIWSDDIVELFIDGNFDQYSYAHLGINSFGMVVDEWLPEGFNRGSVDRAWDAVDAVAVKVGEDFWSMEYRLAFDDEKFPRPQAGSRWGFNAVRVFRGQQYNQWSRTYGSGHQPGNFGVLVFK